MKSEEEIKKAMDNIKDQLPTATAPNEAVILQSQFGALKWVLDEGDKDEG